MRAYEIQLNDPQEVLIVEQALAMYRDLKQVADEAPDGEVLHRAEQAAVWQGRELARKSLETVLKAQAEDLEKNFCVPHVPMRRQPVSSWTPKSKRLDGGRDGSTRAG